MTSLMGAFAAATALLLAWNVFAGGRIAQMRNAPKELRLFRVLSGLGGFLIIPAMLIGMAEQSELTGHALTMLAWLWPAVLAMFVVQAGLALAQNLVPKVIGVPLLLYDLTQLLIASTRVAAAHGLAIPAFLLAPGAAQATLLSLLLGASFIGSPLAMTVPLLAPAGQARWRPSVMFRSALAVYALAVVALVAARSIHSTRRICRILRRRMTRRLRSRSYTADRSFVAPPPTSWRASKRSWNASPSRRTSVVRKSKRSRRRSVHAIMQHTKIANGLGD